ncbi:hypothetical protein EQG49_00410 [Periweissella cryptocerci]|uniref:DNA primase n=1 Tax=Periweissella cryptocerci TaxID=2506420 RepID=A0A4P6YQZ5_9LACO|nr:bifunctional DNA primase/polymerase [Periweissella cryptocerci]QBO35016.1 hypothetical protein EQG49_00410 [Periweissella cryptocerci]
MTCYLRAGELQQAGIPVFPLIAGSKIPLKGSHGVRDASTDAHHLEQWFMRGECNFGIALEPVHLLVLDLDRNHQAGADGIANFMQFRQERGLTDFTLGNTYTEKTPNEGLHAFFSYPAHLKLKAKVGFLPGVDILTVSTIMAPSQVNGRPYTIVNGTLNAVAPAPRWLLEVVSATPLPAEQVTESDWGVGRRQAKFRGGKADSFLNRVFDGCGHGERNNWVASVVGSLLASGTREEVAYHLIHLFNREFVTPALAENEVNQIFKSILGRHVRRYGR